MRFSRREFAAFAGAATLFGPVSARAGAPDIFVQGQNMPANLDPHQILDLGATAYALNVYDNLFRYEDNPAKMQPWLAESHTMSPDGLVWDFKLRRGVKFHDGSELTADDVVYSFHRVLALGKRRRRRFCRFLSQARLPPRIPIRSASVSSEPTGRFSAHCQSLRSSILGC